MGFLILRLMRDIVLGFVIAIFVYLLIGEGSLSIKYKGPLRDWARSTVVSMMEWTHDKAEKMKDE